MHCDEAGDALHAYLDGELGPTESLRYEQHLGQCPACGTALAEQQTLRMQMQATPLYHRAPDALRERLRAALQPAPAAPMPRRPSRALVRRGAVAASILLLVGLGFSLARFTLPSSDADTLTRAIATAHIRSLQEDHLVDVRSSDTHQVKPWFNGRVDFSPPTLDLKQHGFPLVGGRLDYLDGRAVAALVYRRRAHVINLFVWPDDGGAAESTWQGTRHGYQYVHWTRAGMNYWAVSDLNAPELNEMVQRLRE